ncbi:MAG: hypothetical protein WCT49_02995 [Candidatus Paceibacterota bacterium]|nr:hypothetical protein [Candidatus Paceibacterota bacterium]
MIREALAFHEAGHAIVALAMRKLKLLGVTINENGGFTGVSWLAGRDNFEKLCFFIAGNISENLFSNGYSEHHSTADRAQAQEVLLLLSRDRNIQCQYFLFAAKTVQDILNNPLNVALIYKIAAVLMAKNVLSVEEINAMMI